MIEPKTIRPFRRFCMTIGELPTSYMESMSYYELLEWLCKYLEETVIPAVNNNSAALTELQEYVKNYFDSLDIQSEIDTKLDEMAESGQLTDIIAQYLQLAGVLAYDTIEDMSEAENIANGSICYVLGQTTYNDGKGGFYKIRTITVSDVVDGYNIVALDVSDTLIAERMPNYFINEINDRIDLINTNNLLKNKRFVFIGDSYVTGTLNGTPAATDGWAKRIKDLLGLDNDNCFIYGEGASGFAATGHDGHKFYDLLNNNLSNITDKDTIDYVVVCGGINDAASTVANIDSKLSDFGTLVANNFPNAKWYVGCISTNSKVDNTGTTSRRNINHIALTGYKNCIKYKGFYLNGVENILKDYSLMGTDYIHPSVDGYNMLAYGIIQALETGKYEMVTDVKADTIESSGRSIASSSINIYTKVTNNMLMINIDGYVTYNSNFPFNTDENLSMFKINSDLIRKNFSSDLWLTGAIITVGSSAVYCDAFIFINDDNELVIRFKGYPAGVTQGTRINLRSNNFFCIDG